MFFFILDVLLVLLTQLSIITMKPNDSVIWVFDSGMFSDRCHTKRQKNLKASLHSAAVKHVAGTQVRRRRREGRQNFLLLLDLPGQQCTLRVRHCRNVLLMSYICIIIFNNKQLTVLETSWKKQTIFSGHVSHWNRH